MEPIPFLQKLITKKTPILTFENDPSISRRMKYQVLGLSSGNLANCYVEHMYYQNQKWFYFKKEEKKYRYPFYLLDELMGSFLSKQIDLPSVAFEIARTKGSLGIVSENFRKDGFDYYFFEQLPIKGLLENRFNFTNLEVLKSFCRDLKNEQELEEHILKLLAVDLYMLQKDRGSINLQFQMEQATQYFDFALIYDYANCIDTVDYASFTIKNPIVTLNYNTIHLLFQKYPKFIEYLTILNNQTMSATWDQICETYHFNQDCYAYEQAKQHYAIKDENQKHLYKEFLKCK